jgi:tetratricopeptide (TPR) repeat protein
MGGPLLLLRTRTFVIGGLIVVGTAIAWRMAASRFSGPAFFGEPSRITIDYPGQGAIFPPEFPPPTFQWRDPDPAATSWVIDVTFPDGAAAMRAESAGEGMRIGEIDPRCSSSSNSPPALTPEQAQAHTWTPDESIWAAIKKNSRNRPATIAISGRRPGSWNRAVSRGQIAIETSSDPVGAPIFYRDVPLMPSATEKGVIKPLATKMIPLIAWRLRNVAEKKSRVLMGGLHTCANCHSFSADGKTLGMDIDGPLNDKGLYALVRTQPQMSIREEDLIAWSTFRGKLGGKLRVGFMSQVSPDGSHVITTVNDPGIDQTDYEHHKNPIDLTQNYYVTNFKDYRFLQVFYPTRGILAWYSREAGHLQYLPGADDVGYVHANAVWSPDGKYLVFVRAQAKDAYTKGVPPAEFANDPKETQIQYDLYRIPFNDGKGGRAEPVLGASQNGMSNTFPKISPDGKWIVFVQCRNGLLMRPDGQLFIVPASGGEARRMRCNTPLMNSWHSFSPNGRWLVFSSKSRSPYTQMFLTHIDDAGNDSPAILIENATAANRAVNIPEFVNMAPDGMVNIQTPVAEYALHVDVASEMMQNGQYAASIPEWEKALTLAPAEAMPRNNYGVALAETGKVDEAIAQYRKALELNPKYPEAQNNWGEALAGRGAVEEAIPHFEKAVQLDAGYGVARANLGAALAQTGRTDQAIVHFQKAVEINPDAADVRKNLGLALADKGRFQEAIVHLQEAVRISGGKNPAMLDLLGRVYAETGKFPEAAQAARQALDVATRQNNFGLCAALKARISLYESGKKR